MSRFLSEVFLGVVIGLVVLAAVASAWWPLGVSLDRYLFTIFYNAGWFFSVILMGLFLFAVFWISERSVFWCGLILGRGNISARSLALVDTLQSKRLSTRPFDSAESDGPCLNSSENVASIAPQTPDSEDFASADRTDQESCSNAESLNLDQREGIQSTRSDDSQDFTFSYPDMDDIRESIIEEVLDGEPLDRGCDVLMIISSVAPVVGFMGTLVGLINSFRQLGSGGEVKSVLGGLGVAMSTSLAGVFISLLCILFAFCFEKAKESFEVWLKQVIQSSTSKR